MIHSNYLLDQITSPIYEQISQKLLSLVQDEDTRKKEREKKLKASLKRKLSYSLFRYWTKPSRAKM